MRITPLSTATACTLGVLAAYGISNRVDGSPQPETPKDKPAQPSQAAASPQVAATLPLTQAVAPPETFPPSPLEISRDLAKERQQREAKLAQDLAKVSVPPPARSASSTQPTHPVTSINISDVSRPSINRIVARSVAPQSVAAQIGRSQPAPRAAQPHSQTIALATTPPAATPVPTPTPAPVAVAPSATPTPTPAPAAPSAPATQAVQTASTSVQPVSSPSTQPTLRIETPATQQPTVAIAGTQPAAQAAQPVVAVSPSPAAQSAPTPAPAAEATQAETVSASANLSVIDRVRSRLVAALPDLDVRNKTEASSEAPSDATTKNDTATSPQPRQPAQPSTAQSSTAQSSTAQPTATPQPSAATRSTMPVTRQAAPAATLVSANSVASRPAEQPAPGQPIFPSSGAATAPSLDEAYTLGPGDRISLRFFNTPEYNGDVQVLSDGTLNLPVVGSVLVNGMTLQQAESRIASLYQAELRYAVVTVTLQQQRPLQVAIVGEVQQPGSYTLTAEGSQPNLVRAIQTAGGTTQAADVRYIQIQRSTYNNPNQIITVNLADFVQSGNLSQDLKLRDGDRIIIPTATAIDFNQAAQLSAANFAGSSTQPVDVAVVGEIFRPGAYRMGGDGGRPTVSQAIQMAGGVKPSADVRQIQIRRATRVGVEQVINVDFFQLLQTGNLTQDLVLQPGDRITIPAATTASAADTTLLSAANLSPQTMQVNVVGEVKSPGAVQLPPGSTLNQVILAAGGLNNRATNEIELIRLEPNGSLTRRTIEVEMKEGFNTANNPLILNNDVVVVGRSGAAQFSDQINQINSVIGPLLQLLPFQLPSLF